MDKQTERERIKELISDLLLDTFCKNYKLDEKTLSSFRHLIEIYFFEEVMTEDSVRPHALPAAVQEEVIRLYKQGVNISKIHKEVHKDYYLVYELIRKYERNQRKISS